MKAILVIDVPDNDIGKEFVYCRHNGKEWIDAGRYKFMPMPKKLEKDKRYVSEVNTYIEGWNDCIDELYKEEHHDLNSMLDLWSKVMTTMRRCSCCRSYFR